MRRQKFDSINVVPFIDIMLVLLVIVLTTASFIQMGVIRVDLPKASISNPVEVKKELLVTIDKSGKLFVANVEIKQEEFLSKIQNYPKDTPIYISCDKSARFDSFVYILDVLKANSYENIGIFTTHE
ncbi:MAG: biopolymer transporter ExbD [Epsilonproteobacteria bacterium]|nr:biopolymer transporter ExbD [Campylobacterota bacterium]MBD3839871.1 biopolymer transporter ExbD [Campylobacterota bacterium]